MPQNSTPTTAASIQGILSTFPDSSPSQANQVSTRRSITGWSIKFRLFSGLEFSQFRQDTAYQVQQDTADQPELSEVHYSVEQKENGSEHCKWFCVVLYETPERAVVVIRPPTPPQYKSPTYAMDLSTRTAMRHHGLQDDHSLHLPEYSYIHHDDLGSSFRTAHTAARNKGNTALITNMLYTYPNLSPSDFALLEEEMKEREPGSEET